MSVTIKVPEEITLGAGVIRYQEYDESGVYNAMVDLGMMKDVKITAEREFEIIDDGTPITEVKRCCKREKGTLECILGEEFPEEKILKLGAGSVEDVSPDTGVDVTETKTLTGVAFETLKASYKTNPDLSVTVQSTDVTPVSYTEDDDYILGEKEGCWAIRRVSTGDIPNRGQVEVTYNYDIAGYRKFTFGGDSTSKTYYMEHIKKTDDGDLKITKMFKVAPPGKDEMNNMSESFGNSSVSFPLQADSSKPAGEQLYEKDYEDDEIV